MKATVRQFSSRGDDVLLEYDTETADLAEVNATIEQLERQCGGKAFDYKTGEPLDGKLTREQTDVLILQPICGG